MLVRRKQTWQAVCAALVVAIGIGLAWGLLGGWMFALSETFKSTSVTEDISIAADGTPVISTMSQENYQQVTASRRTIDGQSWPIDYEFWMQSGGLAPYAFPAVLVRMPLQWRWGGRVGGYTDGANPPANWYVVRDDEPESHCYFAGFDSLTKLPIGYIGRSGFQVTEPERAEQFVLPGVYSRQLMPFLASTQYFQMWSAVNASSFGARQADPPGWLVYLAEGNKVWEVDLRKRSARTFAEIFGIVSIATIDTPETIVELGMGHAASMQPTKTQPSKDANAAGGTRISAEKTRKKAPDTATLLAVRTSDKLVLLTPAGKLREFSLPHDVPNVNVVPYWIAPREVLYEFQDGNWSGGIITRLLWADESGKVAKDRQVKLASYAGESPRAMAWAFSGLVPVPIVYGVGALVAAPLSMVQNYVAPTFAAGLTKSLSVAGAPLACVLALAAVFAWFTIQMQRKYRRSATGVWAAFVFLFGLPGFVTYLVEHRRVKLEACAQCGKVVPRDREACAACDREFAPPARIGTEIFA